MKAVLVFCVLLAGCRLFMGGPVPSGKPVQPAAPLCFNLGPNGDGYPLPGGCAPNLSNSDGLPCLPCFYDNGCTTGSTYCVNDRLGCNDPACSYDRAKRRK